MHGAGFAGEGVADIVEVGLDVGADFPGGGHHDGLHPDGHVRGRIGPACAADGGGHHGQEQQRGSGCPDAGERCALTVRQALSSGALAGI